MSFVEVDGNWINPEHIVAVVPGKRRGLVECEVMLLAGHFVRVERDAESVAQEIAVKVSALGSIDGVVASG